MDKLGDYLKRFERIGEAYLLPGLPIVARLDGRAFHTYTKPLTRPYEPWLCKAMQDTTAALVSDFHAVIGYTQSDEITLIFKPSAKDGEHNFSGRVQKITSVLAGFASAFFALQAHGKHPHPNKVPHFDCRVFQCPNESVSALTLVWRQEDAIKNSLSMLAQSHFSHKQLHGKHSKQLHDMLHEKGVNWNDFPTHFKSGSFFKRVKVEASLDQVPEAHMPTAPVYRTKVQEVHMPKLRSVSNLEGVVFRDETPILREDLASNT